MDTMLYLGLEDIDLTIFDEGGGGAAGGEGTGAAEATQDAVVVETSAKTPGRTSRASRRTASNVVYGKEAPGTAPEPKEEPAPEPKEPTTEDRAASFEKMIKGEYKDQFNERTQKIINERFKQMKDLEAQLEDSKRMAPVLEAIAKKYNVDAADTDALLEALAEDSDQVEKRAMENGFTVEQQKLWDRLQRENEAFRTADRERREAEAKQRQYDAWFAQGEEVKEMYPKFDLKKEVSDPDTGMRFVRRLNSGVDVQTCYEIIHKDEIITGAMQYTAAQVREQTVNDIKARGMRPAENGGSGSAAAVVRKSDPTKFTKKDREDISRRARGGEKIYL